MTAYAYDAADTTAQLQRLAVDRARHLRGDREANLVAECALLGARPVLCDQTWLVTGCGVEVYGQPGEPLESALLGWSAQRVSSGR